MQKSGNKLNCLIHISLTFHSAHPLSLLSLCITCFFFASEYSNFTESYTTAYSKRVFWMARNGILVCKKIAREYRRELYTYIWNSFSWNGLNYFIFKSISIIAKGGDDRFVISGMFPSKISTLSYRYTLAPIFFHLLYISCTYNFICAAICGCTGIVSTLGLEKERMLLLPLDTFDSSDPENVYGCCWTAAPIIYIP